MDRFLKKCPFCGSEAYFDSNYTSTFNQYFTFVKCSFCGAQTKIFNTHSDPKEDSTSQAWDFAANAWNRREWNE